MHDTSHWGTSAVVDVSHRTCNGTCSRYTAEDGACQVSHTLSYQLGVRVMAIANYTISHRGRKQRFYSTKNGDSDSWRHQTLYHVPRNRWHLGLGQLVRNRESVADGLNAIYARILLQQQHGHGHHDDGNQASGQFLQYIIIFSNHGPCGNHGYRAYAHTGTPPVYGAKVADICYPLLYKVAGHALHRQSEQILDLCGKDGQRNTAGKTYHYGVRYILDDGTQVQHAKHNQEHARHQCGNGQSLKSVLLYNTVNDDDKCAGRSAYLHLRSAQQRYDETCYDSGDDTLLRGYARCDTECDGQRQCYDTYDDTGQQVGGKLLFVVVPKCRQ